LELIRDVPADDFEKTFPSDINTLLSKYISNGQVLKNEMGYLYAGLLAYLEQEVAGIGMFT